MINDRVKYEVKDLRVTDVDIDNPSVKKSYLFNISVLTYDYLEFNQLKILI